MPRLGLVRLGSAAALVALGLSGCASGGLTPGPLPYQHSNAIAPAGYSESLIGPDRYRIEVKGPVNTPRERLEKIAATRAAEIGKDNQLKYFKIESVQHTTHCSSFQPGPRSAGANSPPKTLAYAVATADVSYTRTPPDPTYLDSRRSFTQFRAELDQDQAAPAPIDPAAGPQCS